MNTSVQSIFPFDVECKKGNSTTLERAYVQSAKRCPAHLRPLVILEPDRKKAVVFGKEDHLLNSANNEKIYALQPDQDEYGFVRRKKRNTYSLYDIWYDNYREDEKFILTSTNPLCEPDVPIQELSNFVQMKFTHWLNIWCTHLV